MLHPDKHRVSLETIDTVLTFTLPAIQRGVDEGHVDCMVADQEAEYSSRGCFSLLQSITVAALAGKVYVIDGQHRIRAYEALAGRGFPVGGVVLPVVHYAVNDRADLLAYYNRINQHMPVHPLELEDAWQTFGRPFLEWLTHNYSVYIKKEDGNKRKTVSSRAPTTRCPHIGTEQLKTELGHRNDLFDVCGGDVGLLCAAVKDFNDSMALVVSSVPDLSSRDHDDVRDVADIDPVMKKRLRDCLEKVAAIGKPRIMEGGMDVDPPSDPVCVVNKRPRKKTFAVKNGISIEPCFLGAFRRFEWLDVCAERIKVGARVDVATCWALLLVGPDCATSSIGRADENSVDGVHAKYNPKRSPIPYEVRARVWAKTNDPTRMVGACYACDNDLGFRDMECGHVIARVFGGPDTIDNLMPVCKTCNRDMGVQHMEAYRTRIRSMLHRGNENAI